MGRINKSTIYHILFVLCVAVPSLNIYELTFAIWSITILVTLKAKYSFNFLKYCAYFLLILLIAFFSSFFRDYKLYAYIKDITFLIKPFLGLLIGYQLCKPYFTNPIRILINTSVIISTAHLMVIAYSVLFLNITNMHVLRDKAGYFNDYEVYGLILIIFSTKFGVQLPAKTKRLFLIISAVSVFMYLARTNYIQFIILYLAVKGYFVMTKSSVKVFASLIAFTLISYTVIYNANPRRGSNGIEAFFYKVKIAPLEAFKTKVNVNDWRDFNDNYRSYENILTIRQVSSDGTGTVLFGRGLGSYIDLKKEVWLQTSEMRYIPFLHNGFMTVFLKSGIIGLLIYIFTIIFFFRQKGNNNPIVKYLNRILFATGLFMIISNWVFLGFYNLFDTKVILVGFIIAYKERILKSIT